MLPSTHLVLLPYTAIRFRRRSRRSAIRRARSCCDGCAAPCIRVQAGAALRLTNKHCPDAWAAVLAAAALQQQRRGCSCLRICLAAGGVIRPCLQRARCRPRALPAAGPAGAGDGLLHELRQLALQVGQHLRLASWRQVTALHQPQRLPACHTGAFQATSEGVVSAKAACPMFGSSQRQEWPACNSTCRSHSSQHQPSPATLT